MTTRMHTEERRVQIADACMKIIGEKGLRAFTVAQIAQEVGIKDGSIFRHFKNKEEIIDAVLDRLEEILADTIPSSVPDPLERLRTFFLNRVDAVVKQPGVRALVLSNDLIHAGGPAVFERVMRMRRKAQEYLRACLVEAAHAGLVRRDIDVDDVVILLHGAVMSLVFLSNANALHGAAEDRARQVLGTLLSMVQK
ncbi:MAG: TetR/AcrR family transcriptional regulator [Deltaproteobacteria bacterium]|nr:TetR/AcrR family transcriptional regulator [Deltaproteobacteria bacterium]